MLAFIIWLVATAALVVGGLMLQEQPDNMVGCVLVAVSFAALCTLSF